MSFKGMSCEQTYTRLIVIVLLIQWKHKIMFFATLVEYQQIFACIYNGNHSSVLLRRVTYEVKQEVPADGIVLDQMSCDVCGCVGGKGHQEVRSSYGQAATYGRKRQERPVKFFMWEQRGTSSKTVPIKFAEIRLRPEKPDWCISCKHQIRHSIFNSIYILLLLKLWRKQYS